MNNVQSHHKTVSVDDLIIDPKVQRAEGIDQKRVESMVRKFNPLALGTITVSLRDNGQMNILDGAHRCTVARAVGYKQFVNAEVIEGLTLAQEAELFLLLNATKTPTVASKFLVRVVMGDPSAVEMNEILLTHGWTASPQTAPGNLTAISALERVYVSANSTLKTGRHPEVLDRTIELVTAAWEHDSSAVQQHVLLAVAQLIGRFGPSLDSAKLVAEMQSTRPGVLVGRAKVLRDAQGGTVAAALAKILAGMHNKKRRTNLLPEWVWIR